MSKRLFVVFLLGFSSGLPLALLTGTLQAWFSAGGVSILTTGMLSLIGLPYLIKLVWAPVVDNYSIGPLGRRRSWMLAMQGSLLFGFNLIVWFQPATSPTIIASIALILAFCSATLDTVTDAQRVEYLPKRLHGLGATLAVLGYRLSLLVGGGLALVLADTIGWNITYRIMGLLMLIGIIASYSSAEPAHQNQKNTLTINSFKEPFVELYQRPHFFALIFFILFYKLGEGFTSTTSGIVMPFLIQGLGYSLQTVGYVNKIFGMGALISGGFVAGILLVNFSLYRVLLIVGLLQALANGLFIFLAYSGKSFVLLSITIGFDNFIAGMGTTALVMLLMNSTNKRYTATQYSIFIVVASIPRVLSGPIGAFIQIHFDWTGVYLFAFFVALLFFPFLTKIKPAVLKAKQD